MRAYRHARSPAGPVSEVPHAAPTKPALHSTTNAAATRKPVMLDMGAYRSVYRQCTEAPEGAHALTEGTL